MIEQKYSSLLVIDLSYFIHRALHVKQIFDLRGPDGERSGAVFQVLRMINKELKLNPGYFPVLCSDAGLSPRRIKADPKYKHADERLNSPEILVEEDADSDYLIQYRRQRSLIIEICQYAGIPTLRYSQWEGDDLQYLCTLISKNSRILSDDKDMLQLVSKDHNVTVRRPMADELITEDILLDKYGYSDMYDFVINKAIIGDGSDNIPGCCKGIGGGTSINLIKLFKILHEEGYERIGLESINIENEQLIRDICKDNDIKFRKAMLNFDLNRYKTNLELIDLSKVEFPDSIVDATYRRIDNCRNTVNYFSFAKKLNQLGIHEISPDELISLVHERFSLL